MYFIDIYKYYFIYLLCIVSAKMGAELQKAKNASTNTNGSTNTGSSTNNTNSNNTYNHAPTDKIVDVNNNGQTNQQHSELQRSEEVNKKNSNDQNDQNYQSKGVKNEDQNNQDCGQDDQSSQERDMVDQKNQPTPSKLNNTNYQKPSQMLNQQPSSDSTSNLQSNIKQQPNQLPIVKSKPLQKSSQEIQKQLAQKQKYNKLFNEWQNKTEKKVKREYEQDPGRLSKKRLDVHTHINIKQKPISKADKDTKNIKKAQTQNRKINQIKFQNSKKDPQPCNNLNININSMNQDQLQKDQRQETDEEDQEMKEFNKQLLSNLDDQDKNKNKKPLNSDLMNKQKQKKKQKGQRNDRMEPQQYSSSSQMDENQFQSIQAESEQQIIEQEMLPLGEIIQADLAALQYGQSKSPSTGIYYKNESTTVQSQEFFKKYEVQRGDVLTQLQDLYKLQAVYITNQSFTKNNTKQIHKQKDYIPQQQEEESYIGSFSVQESHQNILRQEKRRNQKFSKIDQKKEYFEFYFLKDFQFDITKQTYEAYEKLTKQIQTFGSPQIAVQINVVEVQVVKRQIFNLLSGEMYSNFLNNLNNPSNLRNIGDPSNIGILGNLGNLNNAGQDVGNVANLLAEQKEQPQQKQLQKIAQIVYKYKNQIIGKITQNNPTSSSNSSINNLKSLKLVIDHKFIKLDILSMQKVAKAQNRMFDYNPENSYGYRAIHRLCLNYPKYHRLHGKYMIKNLQNMLQNRQIDDQKQQLMATFGKIVNTVNSLPNVSNEKIVNQPQSIQQKSKDQVYRNEASNNMQSIAPILFYRNPSYLRYLQSQGLAKNRQSPIAANSPFLSNNFNNSNISNNSSNNIFSQKGGVFIGGQQKQRQLEQGSAKSKQFNKKSILTQNIFDSETQVGTFFDLTEKEVKQENPSFLFKGQLKKYQKLALSWMLHREECPIHFDYGYANYQYEWRLIPNTSNLFMNEVNFYIRPYLPVNRKFVRGGILADQMGLGKTIMSVALIATHFRKEFCYRELYEYSRKEELKAGTLIIVPLSILNQWKKVVDQYLPHLKCCVFYGKSRDNLYQQILRSQIVITTQSILKNQRAKQKKNGSRLQFGYSLYHYSWLRVIIDQAHSLRTQTSLYFNAAKQLHAEYRWCLTGTPFQNKLEDIQSLLIFLQYTPWSDANTWDSQFKQSKDVHTSQKMIYKMKSILKGVIIRRKKQSKDQDGNQLLQIDPHNSLNYQVSLSLKLYRKYWKISKTILNNVKNFEQKYDTFDPTKPNQSSNVNNQNNKRKQFQKQVNKLLMSTFEKLTKMRQFCCHPSLYDSKSKYINYQQFPKHYAKFLENRGVPNKKSPTIKQKKYNAFQLHLNEQFGSYKQRKQIRKNTQQQSLNMIMRQKQFYCAVCSRQIKSKHKGLISICLHFYCQKCFKHSFSKKGKAQNAASGPVQPEIQQNWFNSRKKKPKAKKLPKTITCPSHACYQPLYYDQFLHLPRMNRFGNRPIYQIKQHQKIQFIINYLKNAKTQQKIIVFTSFVGMVQIISESFKKQDINYLTMIGEDSHVTRSKRLTDFKQNPQIQVFVISLKCGYAGLNLQMANKVIFCQTWWNPAIEDQAIGRLHRMGQQKQVEVVRLITKNTIQQQMHIINQQKKLKSQFILDSDTKQGKKRNSRLTKVLQIKQMLMKSLQRLDSILQQKKKTKDNKDKKGLSNMAEQSSSSSQSDQDSSIQQQQQSQHQSLQQDLPGKYNKYNYKNNGNGNYN